VPIRVAGDEAVTHANPILLRHRTCHPTEQRDLGHDGPSEPTSGPPGGTVCTTEAAAVDAERGPSTRAARCGPDCESAGTADRHLADGGLLMGHHALG
jgi:hypothetical protein